MNAVIPYLSVSLDELQNLPIPDLAAERCHLHMWATANNFLFDAKEVIEGWGFRVVGNFVWAKPQLGRGNYWRQSHEIMLTAVRGKDDRFDDMSLRSWIVAPRNLHHFLDTEFVQRLRVDPRKITAALTAAISDEQRQALSPGCNKALGRAP